MSPVRWDGAMQCSTALLTLLTLRLELLGAEAAEPSVLWNITEGTCTVEGSCVRSPRYPYDYPGGSDNGCRFHLLLDAGEAVTLTATRFEVRTDDDSLYIEGHTITGHGEEPRQKIADISNRWEIIDGRSKFTWEPTLSFGSGGWRLCAQPIQERPGQECTPRCTENKPCHWCGGRHWLCCKPSKIYGVSEGPCVTADYSRGTSDRDTYQCAWQAEATCALENERSLRRAFTEVLGGPWSSEQLWTWSSDSEGPGEGLVVQESSHPQTFLRSRPFVVSAATRISVSTKSGCVSKSSGPGSHAAVSGDATDSGFLGIALHDTRTGRWVAHRSRTCDMVEDQKLRFSPKDLAEHLGKVMTLDIIDASSTGSISVRLPWQNFLENGTMCQSETWDADIRLRRNESLEGSSSSNSSANLSGMLEIYHSGRWAPVTMDSKERLHAGANLQAVACTELGLAPDTTDVQLAQDYAADGWLRVDSCTREAGTVLECASLWGAHWGYAPARPVHIKCQERTAVGTLPWDVVSGPCVRRGACITSPNFPAEYPANSECKLKIFHTGGLLLRVVHFDTELDWDKLTINDETYSGRQDEDEDDVPPASLTATGTIKWEADSETQGSGWKLCTNFSVEVAASGLGDGRSFALDPQAWAEMAGQKPQPGSDYVIRQERGGSDIWTGRVTVNESSVQRTNGAAAGQWEAGDTIFLSDLAPCPCKMPFTWEGGVHFGCINNHLYNYPWCIEAEPAPWRTGLQEFETFLPTSCKDTICPVEAADAAASTTTSTTYYFLKCVETLGCYPDNLHCKALYLQASKCLSPQDWGYEEGCKARALPSPSSYIASQREPWLYSLAVLLLFLLLYGADKLWQRRQLNESRRAVDNATAQSLAVAVGRHFLPSHSVNTHQFRGMSPAEASIALKFDQLGLQLRDGRNVLEGVSGEFKATHLIAIMGPSGAGKTTFMNVLAGRATYGTRTGKVWFNGTEVDPVKLRPSFGFVPQDDVIHPRLTVRENLLFSARLRNPRGTPRVVINDIVDDALAVLQIGHVQSSLVGSVEERGISGGQRKRVNIGWELVACPTLLFLDEPTTGLDSTTSLQIINSLQKMTELEMTICMVIHQPRYQLFTLFDDVLLLGPGGRTVYLGPSQRTASYFEGFGYQMPHGENAADWFMDVLSGCEPHPTLPEFTPSMLFEKWKEQGPSYSGEVPRRMATQSEENSIVESALQEEWSKVDKDNSGHLDQKELLLLLERCGVRDPSQTGVEDLLKRISSDGERVLFSDLLAYIIGMTSVVAVDMEAQRSLSLHSKGRADRPKTSAEAEGGASASTALLDSPKPVAVATKRPFILQQLWVLLLRRFVQFHRENRQRLVDLGLMAMCACVMGILQKGSIYASSKEMASMLGTFHMGLALLVVTSSLKVFGEDRTIFWRESGSGISVLAYMLAKVVGNVFDLLFQCSLYTLVYFYIVRPDGSYHIYWLPCLFLTLLAASWGYFISAMLPPQNATIAAVISMLILCGILGNPAKIPDRLHDATEAPMAISPSRWSVPMTFVAEMYVALGDYNECKEDVLRDLMGDYQGAIFAFVPLYDPYEEYFENSACQLLFMSLVLHLACYLGLKCRNRDKQV